MRLRLVGLVEGVAPGEDGLVVDEFLLLRGVQDGEFPGASEFAALFGCVYGCVFEVLLVVVALGWEIIAVLEFGQMLFAPETPAAMMVMSDEDHVVRVDGTEWCKTITHDSEQSDKHVIDNIDDILLPGADRDPADQEEHPRSTKERDQRCI